jgi:hypothetical protein
VRYAATSQLSSRRLHTRRKIFCTTFAIIGILWAVLIHLVIYGELAGSRPGDKIHAVENMSESMLKSDLVTNGMICVSESDATNFVKMTRDAIGARDRQVASLFHKIDFASALVIILSICAFIGWKDEKPAA